MDKTNELYLKNITEITGKTESEIKTLLVSSKLIKHSEIRAMFMEKLDLSFGFANTLALIITKSDGASLAEGKSMDELLDEIYSGKKAQFLVFHEIVMGKIETMGPFEIAPKKGYLSLRVKKQFAMIGPKTNTRMEIGLNINGIDGTDVLLAQPKGSMCKFIVKISTQEDLTADLFKWLQEAYNQAQ